MNTLREVFSSADFWKFVVPLIGAVIAWFANEWQKRLTEQHQRKEANYKDLLRSLRGFYAGAQNAAEARGEFLNQLNTSWLYCPDDVIRTGYAFLDTVRTGASSTDAQKELALGAFVAAIRRDALARTLVRSTALTATDFRHLGIP